MEVGANGADNGKVLKLCSSPFENDWVNRELFTTTKSARKSISFYLLRKAMWWLHCSCIPLRDFFMTRVNSDKSLGYSMIYSYSNCVHVYFSFYLDNNYASDGSPNDDEPEGNIHRVEVEASENVPTNQEVQRAPLLENNGKCYGFTDKNFQIYLFNRSLIFNFFLSFHWFDIDGNLPGSRQSIPSLDDNGNVLK